MRVPSSYPGQPSAGDPDVWEVVRVIRNVEARGDKAITKAATWLGLSPAQVRIAVLLLDEHYPPSIAKQLREKGHEVLSVQEEADLRGMTDPDLFAEAQRRKSTDFSTDLSC